MIRETRALVVPSSGEDVQQAIAYALVHSGFELARREPGYLEARRGTVDPLRVVSRMKLHDAPVVVCVSVQGSPDGSCQVTAGAYPDLGRGVLMGPIARRKWRAAMLDAVTTVVGACSGTCEGAAQPTA